MLVLSLFSLLSYINDTRGIFEGICASALVTVELCIYIFYNVNITLTFIRILNHFHIPNFEIESEIS